MEIRKIKLDDSAKLAELATQLGHKSTETEISERLEKIIPDEDQVVFVAEESGNILGFIYTVVFCELLSGFQARIWGLDVDQNTQGKGIGRALVEVGEDWARKKGAKMMKVNSNIMRTGAHKFYEKVGYIKYKEQAIFKKKI